MQRRGELRKLKQSGDVQHCEVPGTKTTSQCYNGGTCSTMNDGAQSSYSPCTCPAGTRGSHCEETCTLPCENGGQCLFEDDNTGGQDRELSLPPWGQSQDGMFCRCRRGFVGLHCEQEADTCGSDSLICLSGTTCFEQNASKVYRCIQSQVNRCNPSPPHPEFYEGMAVVALCLNGGTCREVMLGNELHSDCECDHGFTGPHCEYVATGDDPPAEIAPERTQEITLSKKDHAAIIALSVFLAGVLFLVALFARRQLRRIRQRRAERMASINLQGFRDGGEDHNDEFAAASPFRAGIDRVVNSFSRTRSLQRKSSAKGGLRHAPVAPTRTTSFVAQRTPSFLSKLTPTFAESEPTRPHNNNTRIALTPHHVQRGQSFRLQRSAGIRPGSVAADREDRHGTVVGDDDAQPRLRRSASIERGWHGWKRTREPYENGVEKKSSDHSLEMIPTSSTRSANPSERQVLRRRSNDDNHEESNGAMPSISFV